MLIFSNKYNRHMLLSYLKQNKFYIFATIIYLLSLIFVKEMNFLFYNTSDSPDFSRYFRYLEYNIVITQIVNKDSLIMIFNLFIFILKIII
jgi:hypothetical protein